jgi:hypothetical protein
MIKKIIGFLIGAVVLIGVCVASIIIYFQNIDGVSVGTRIEQSQTDKPALLVIDIQEGITGKSASKMTKSMVRQSGPFLSCIFPMCADSGRLRYGRRRVVSFAFAS